MLEIAQTGLKVSSQTNGSGAPDFVLAWAKMTEMTWEAKPGLTLDIPIVTLHMNEPKLISHMHVHPGAYHAIDITQV